MLPPSFHDSIEKVARYLEWRAYPPESAVATALHGIGIEEIPLG
jgi:hypothetical protein